jgi:hypothetical protein
MWCLHSAGWWRRHWERTGLVTVERADTMPDGWRFWLEWQRAVAPDNVVEIQALEADQGEYLCYVRAVARRRPEVPVDNRIVSVPPHYITKPLLRGDPVGDSLTRIDLEPTQPLGVRLTPPRWSSILDMC